MKATNCNEVTTEFYLLPSMDAWFFCMHILPHNIISEWLWTEQTGKNSMHYSLLLNSEVNLLNLISHLNSGVEDMECSLPMDGRRVSLTQLSKDSFRECQASLTLTDLLIIIFSGISVSVVAIMTSFFLASTVHCFQRWSKGTKGDEEESEEWYYILKGLTWSNYWGKMEGHCRIRQHICNFLCTWTS